MQTVDSTFHQKSQANIRKHRWSVLASFDKTFDDSVEFFTLDSSLLDDGDILAPVGDNPIQLWDYYVYSSHTDRVMSIEWGREVDFPYSVQSSYASLVLNNFDNYYSSNTNSPIRDYLLPARPIKVLTGYHNEPLLQQFVGLTQGKPELDQSARTAKLEALDFLNEIFKLELSDSIAMSDVRTDEALAALFEQFGVEPVQYSLARGRNTIPFLFLSRGSSAADVFREIMQAEGGSLWIDEQGIIRFDHRLAAATGPVITFKESSIVSVTTTADTEIINKVKIRSNIREVQIAQPIHAGSGQLSSTTISDPLVIPAGETADYIIKLSDPLAGYSEPTLGFIMGDSWFTAVTGGGSNVVSLVSVTYSVLKLDELVITFENTNSFDVYLNQIEVYGEPAKIIDTIQYEAFDQDSIDAYGEFLLDIESDMFGSESNCESFAYTILDAYAQFDSIIEIRVKGNPALQLNDVIWVDTEKIAGQFQIIKMTSSISRDGVNEIIKAKRYDPRFWFVLDQSELDESDVLAP